MYITQGQVLIQKQHLVNFSKKKCQACLFACYTHRKAALLPSIYHFLSHFYPKVLCLLLLSHQRIWAPRSILDAFSVPILILWKEGLS